MHRDYSEKLAEIKVTCISCVAIFACHVQLSSSLLVMPVFASSPQDLPRLELFGLAFACPSCVLAPLLQIPLGRLRLEHATLAQLR